jgi:hypothetical protein
MRSKQPDKSRGTQVFLYDSCRIRIAQIKDKRVIIQTVQKGFIFISLYIEIRL